MRASLSLGPVDALRYSFDMRQSDQNVWQGLVQRAKNGETGLVCGLGCVGDRVRVWYNVQKWR